MNFAMDQNGDGVVNFKDLWSFLTQKVFGFALWIILAVVIGAGYYFQWFGLFGKKKRRSW